MILYDFINCPAFVDIKQTLQYKLTIEEIQSERHLFFWIFPYVFFAFLCWIKLCSGCFKQAFFHLGVKKWLLVALDRWLS